MKVTTKIFIERAKKIHEDKYDYSKTIYITGRKPVIINCPIHGDFKQCPEKHIGKKRGCPECGKIKSLEKRRTPEGRAKSAKLLAERNKLKLYKKPSLTTEMFIKKSIETHGDKYDYSKVDYKISREKVIIICKKHGEFSQLPFNHINGNGCSKCRESHGERDTRKALDNLGIKYIQQFSFSDLRGKRKPLVIDFYLPDLNTCIEYDGEQHFSSRGFITEERHLEVKRLDEIKNKYCDYHNIKMIRIPYTIKTIKSIEHFILEHFTLEYLTLEHLK